MYELSIIIPHFNSSKMLETLLNTIPKNKNIEVIIVDDKSEKKHIEYIEKILKRKEDHRIRFFLNDRPIKSASTCRNIGIENAKGKWLFFADADDYFIDGFYEKVQPYFKSTNEVVFFMPDSVHINTQERANRHIIYENMINNYLRDKSLKNELYIRYKMHSPWLKIVQSAFLKTHDIKFDEVIASTDVMFSTKIGHHMKYFDVSEDIIYIITRSVGSLTVNYTKEVIESRAKVFILWYAFLKERLSKEELELLDIEGLHLLSLSFYNSLSMLLKVFFLFCKNDIPILSRNSRRFSYVLPRIYRRFVAKDIEKKYRKFN
ncbi:MAG: glycosyltransferase family 2 protein [Campylobacterales bacterium]|nr:glycosyltransferase family 2 protein [Campylobacterales bacterium]